MGHKAHPTAQVPGAAQPDLDTKRPDKEVKPNL